MHSKGVPKNRRWALRRAIQLEANVTDSAGLTYAAQVTDISQEGCGIQLTSGSNLMRTRLHTIQAKGLGPLTAYVIWSADSNAGLAFSEPCDPAIIESLTAESLYDVLRRALAHSLL